MSRQSGSKSNLSLEPPATPQTKISTLEKCRLIRAFESISQATANSFCSELTKDDTPASPELKNLLEEIGESLTPWLPFDDTLSTSGIQYNYSICVYIGINGKFLNIVI